MTRITAETVRELLVVTENDFENAVESFLRDTVLPAFSKRLTNCVPIDLGGNKIPMKVLTKSLESRGFRVEYRSVRDESYIIISV